MLLSTLISKIFSLHFAAIVFLPAALGQKNSSACDRTCGIADRVPFPFGFSDDCKIKLICSNDNKIVINGFEIRNITSASLLLQIPAKCDRKVENLRGLFGSNYALTWQNGLLLQNCTKTLYDCVIPTALLKERFNLSNCNSRNDSFSCISKDDSSNSTIMAWETITQTGCSTLFSSVTRDVTNPSASLDFEKLELEWWVDGNCSCHPNANCSSFDSRHAFRCQCHQGFEGDGFRDGNGCRKNVSASSYCNVSKYMSSRCGRTTRVGVLIGGVLIGVICGLGLIWLIMWRKRKIRRKEDEMGSDEELDDDFQRGTGPKRFTYRELLSATNNFSEEGKLGQGGFGGVYKGFLNDLNLAIAVKRVSEGSNQGKKEYASEVKIISRLRHRNLVQLIGWSHSQSQFFLVYELMPNGSLDFHLFGKRSPLPWPVRYKIALGLASALFYLHEEWEQCVVHRDIKSSNVMLDSGFNAKLGDFGLARLVDHDSGSQTTVLAGTMGYMAPECVITGKASKETDVFSFGVVVLEIACGRRSVEPKAEESEIRLVDWVWNFYGRGRLLDVADKSLNMDFDKKELQALMAVGLWCAHPDYNLRPTIRKAIQVLNFEAPLPDLPARMPVPAYSSSPMHDQIFAYTV